MSTKPKPKPKSKFRAGDEVWVRATVSSVHTHGVTVELGGEEAVYVYKDNVRPLTHREKGD